ncbi:metallophosphoesterase family protein [Paenibacillus thalictri]|uniref:Phosphohydrolase n=1 Tax=Paenibacillus thalictri TaxID=2527873 RepID=A0A4Q9DKJ5_9BACL|nr:metallophosphoesterase [Paenibacillus thalictri]TBL75303.1 phosphohydrolase [Paenibacillus thalictri]
MSRRQFIKLLLTMLTLAVAAVSGLWKWFASGIEAHEQPKSPGAGESRGAEANIESTQAPVQTEPLLSFMIMSDTHINGGLSEQSDKLRKALDDVISFEPKVEALLITGDITDSGSESDYREYNKVMKGYKHLPPLHVNMGNHDYYNIWIDKHGQWNKDAMPNGHSDEKSRTTFMAQFGMDQVYHDFRVNGCHIIMLSQETYVQERPEVGEGAYYSDTQLAWFKQKMEEHRDGSPVFVMIHQPLPAMGQDGGSHSLIRAKEFRSILQPYKNVFVFSGHRHQDFRGGQHYTPESFHWFHNASVGRTRSVQPAISITSQGLYVQVYQDKVVLRGREFMDRTWIKEADWSIPLQA